MKKFLFAVTTVILACAVLIFPVFAASDNKKSKDTDTDTTTVATKETVSGTTSYKATISFDTEKAFGLVNRFGSADDSGLTLLLDKSRSQKNGSLAVSQDFAGVLPSGNENCGFYFKSEDFGLENFSGCELSMYVYAQATGADSLKFYTDGDIFVSADIPLTKSPVWKKVNIKVPEDISNNMFGFLIKSSKGFSDTIFYVDEITITDPSGNTLPNVGDYKKYYDSGDEKAAGAFSVVLFVLLIIGVAVACAVFVLRMMRRYR